MKKKTQNVCSDSRLIKKKSNIPNSPTHFLPSLKDSTSPVSSHKFSHSPDFMITSGRTKRDIKSEIQFNLPQRKEEVMPKKHELVIKIKSIDQELEKTKNNSEDMSLNSPVLHEEAESLESITPKSSLNQGSNMIGLEKKFKNITFHARKQAMPKMSDEEGRVPLKLGQNEAENKTYEEFKETIELEVEKSSVYPKLKEMYYADTNALKKEIERLKIKHKKTEAELTSYKQKFDHLTEEFEEATRDYQVTTKNNENLISELKEQIKHQNAEYLVASEIIKKNQTDKKNHLEAIKDLQRQVSMLADLNQTFQSRLTNTSEQLSGTLADLEKERNTVKYAESQLANMKSVLNTNKELNDKVKEMEQTINFLNMNCKEMQQNYSVFKEKAELTENTLRSTLEKLAENLNSSVINAYQPEKSKLRRMNTLNPTPSDPANKWLEKISSLEEEKNFFRGEFDKANKNLAYFRKVIEEKNVIINQLEEKAKADAMKNLEEFKESIKKILEGSLRSLEKSVGQIQENVNCKSCSQYYTPKYMFCHCEHFVCEHCVTNNENCPTCKQNSKIHKMKLLKSVRSAYKSQSDIIEKLKDILGVHF